MNVRPSPTLAALLALLDAREPLDVGPCPACVERGGGWERAQSGGWGTGWSLPDGRHNAMLPDPETWEIVGNDRASRPCPECSEPGPEVECVLCGGDGRCPDCPGTGKRPGPPQPTGLDRRTPGQALRDALGLGFEIRHDRKPRAQPREPDPAARTALQVEADRLMSPGPALTGRTPEENLLGQAIALALAGECGECEGEGVQGRRAVLLGPPWPWQPLSEVEPQDWAEPEIRECPKCNGEGAAVGELAAEIRALQPDREVSS